MADEKVKQWIKQKLDKGVSEDRIRKTLRETDRDPGLVDEVTSGGATEVPEKEGDSLDSDLQEKDFEAENDTDDTSPGDESGDFELSYVDDEDTEKDSGGEDSGSAEKNSGLSLPSMPSISTPSPSLPSNTRRIGVLAAVLLLIAGVGYGGMNFLGTGTSVADTVSGALQTCDQGVGVKMYSVGVSDGETMADVYTDQEAEMVLEIYSGGQKMGEGAKIIDGRGFIKADSVGDRAVFHEEGCDEPNATRRY